MSEQNDAGTVYRKVGRRYYPVDQTFLTEPAPGIWIVEERAHARYQMRVTRLGNLPDPMPAAALYRHYDVAVRALIECLIEAERTYHSVSVATLVNVIFQAIAKAEQKTGEVDDADA